MLKLERRKMHERKLSRTDSLLYPEDFFHEKCLEKDLNMDFWSSDELEAAANHIRLSGIIN